MDEHLQTGVTAFRATLYKMYHSIYDLDLNRQTACKAGV